ncbi:glycosyltransferase family 2 protein [Elusimicrobiota bacterium]
MEEAGFIMGFLEIILYFMIASVIGVYAGYPVLLALIGTIKRNKFVKADIIPDVTVIIAAYNEENSIKEKLKNTLDLDYPENKLEVLVASDGSTDTTGEIVKSFNDPRVRFLDFPERKGKTHVQNEAVKEARGSIIVFSDATTEYNKELIRKIVRNFADPSVGAVGAELIYVNKKKTSVGEGGGLYWKYEKFLKKKESSINSLIGVSGCCYAIRKKLYEPLDPQLISDFVIAQFVYKKGKKTVYEPEAVTYEETCYTTREEFDMRLRVAVRTLNGLWYMRALLNPSRYGFFSVQLFFHKIMRYMIPVFMLVILADSILLAVAGTGYVSRIMIITEMMFYIAALLGGITQSRLKLFYIPYYFCMTNYALLIAIIKFMGGEKKVLWDPLRGNE